MNVTKGFVAFLIVAVVLSSGITYAVTQVTMTTRITISKPIGVDFGVRWTDRDLDQEQNVVGVTRINGDVFNGDTVTINGVMVNSGSGDLTLTWTSKGVPDGLNLELYVNGARWTDSVKISRSSSLNLTIKCVDNGTLVEGQSIFDLVIVAQ